MDFIKCEPDSDGELYPTSSQNQNLLNDVKEDEDPLFISYPLMKTENEVITDFIKSEPSSNSETYHSSSDSDHETVSIKQEEDSALQTFPTKITESEIAPEPSIAAMLAPPHLRERSQEEARDLVMRHNTRSDVRLPVKSERMLSLITQLTALMLQVKILSYADRNAYKVKVLQGSMEEIRARLSPQNRRMFQNSVEIHMQHIQLGLGQCGSLSTHS